MTTSNNTNSRSPGTLISTIIIAGLLAGTLDICCAFLYSYIKNRSTTPEVVLRYISKVAFGKTTFTDPTILTITGLLVHFAIAMTWAILFFILYRPLNLVKINKILVGILYGLLVWTMMNIVILPLWNNRPVKFDPESSSINALILIVAIGLPLSFIAQRFYIKKITRQDKIKIW